MAADRIELRGLRLMGICGALPEERDREQPLEFDVDIEADLSLAGASDALDDTVDYGVLCQVITDTVAGGEPQLLEHLAAEVASAILGADARAAAVTVAVRKLRPPVPQDLASSGVRIRRTQGAG